MIGEYNASNALQRRFVFGPGADEALVWYEGAGTSDRRWLLADQLGSIVAVTNGAGAATAINSYDEYGQPGASNTGRFQYTGQMWLAEAGVYHFKARAYLPALGRFAQTDPAGFAGGINLYAYVGDDPVNATDPSGLGPQERPVNVHPIDPCEVSRGCITVTGPRRNDIGQLNANTFGSAPSAGTNESGGVGASEPGEEEEIVVTGPCNISCQQRRNLAFARTHSLPLFGEGAGFIITEGAITAATGGVGLLRWLRVACCFEGGTLVETVDGLRPIEQIEVGDLVLSRDAATGETAYKPVTALIPGHERELWTVTLVVDGRETTLGTTEDHPWRTADGRWLRTDELTPAMEIMRATGEPARVVSAVNTGTAAITYNLEVADFHTYFVGEDRVWVHNVCLRSRLLSTTRLNPLGATRVARPAAPAIQNPALHGATSSVGVAVRPVTPREPTLMNVVADFLGSLFGP